MKLLNVLSCSLLLLVSLMIAAEEQSTKIADDKLVYMQTSEGLIIYQLLPQISPNHVEQFKSLVKEGFYDGLSFYRVIDGFVAQAGEGEQEWDNVTGKQSKFKSKLNAEFTRPL